MHSVGRFAARTRTSYWIRLRDPDNRKTGLELFASNAPMTDRCAELNPHADLRISASVSPKLNCLERQPINKTHESRLSTMTCRVRSAAGAYLDGRHNFQLFVGVHLLTLFCICSIDI